MGRNRKYATPEEAHEAKLAQAREKYRLSRVGVERKKWGFINTIITEDMIGKTIKELEAEYKAKHPSKSKKDVKEIEAVNETNEVKESEEVNEVNDVEDKD